MELTAEVRLRKHGQLGELHLLVFPIVLGYGKRLLAEPATRCR